VRLQIRVEACTGHDIDREGGVVIGSAQEVEHFPPDDALKINRPVAGVGHRRRVHVELQAGASPGEQVRLEVRGDLDDEDELVGVHHPVDAGRVDLLGGTEEGLMDRGLDPPGELGPVVIHHRDGGVLDFQLGARGDGVHGKGKGVDDHQDDDRVGPDAAEFLPAEPEDVAETPTHLRSPAS
jgi:hypothetical protein